MTVATTQVNIPSTSNVGKEKQARQLAKSTFNQNIIQIRELDKRYTHANPKRGKCMMEHCDRLATHWLTRSSASCCQSDMICNTHAMIWREVKELI